MIEFRRDRFFYGPPPDGYGLKLEETRRIYAASHDSPRVFMTADSDPQVRGDYAWGETMDVFGIRQMRYPQLGLPGARPWVSSMLSPDTARRAWSGWCALVTETAQPDGSVVLGASVTVYAQPVPQDIPPQGMELSAAWVLIALDGLTGECIHVRQSDVQLADVAACSSHVQEQIAAHQRRLWRWYEDCRACKALGMPFPNWMPQPAPALVNA